MDRSEQFNIYDLKPPTKLPTYAPFSEIIRSQGSSSRKRFPRDNYDVEARKIKLICNFGGRFLPRPSDGELRYVGGDRHLIKVSRDISWQELIYKTTKLIRRSHMIRYHLPGEQVNMLITITSDDDLQHMIDECIVLEKSKEMLTMYLFSSIDDERHVHFIVHSSSDAEKEAQFIALINGITRPGDELRTQSLARSSVNDDLDNLMFGINGKESPEGRTEEASVHTRSMPLQSIMVPPSGQLEKKMPVISIKQMSNRDNKVQRNEDNTVAADRNTSKSYLGASVPSESTHTKLHQPVLQQNFGKSHQATGTQDKGSPRNQPLIQLDNDCSVKTQSPNSNNTSPVQNTSRSVHEMLSSLSNAGSPITVSHQRSDESPVKPRRCSTQEEARLHSAEDPLRKNKSKLQLHRKMEISEPTHGSGTPPDYNISVNLHNLEKSVATNNTKKQHLVVPATSSNTSKKDQSSKPTSNSSEAELSCTFKALDKTTNLQPNILVRASSERIQELPCSPRPNEHSSKIARFRSVGTDNINPQIRAPSLEAKDIVASPQEAKDIVAPSQEAKDNVAPSIPDPEIHVREIKSSEQSMPANAAIGRDLASNVQIISNDDLEDLREMGSGAFGTVFHGKWRGTDVAIKRIKNSCFSYPSSQADKMITEFWREAAIISKLHHPNILALYGVVQNGPGGTLATVTEYMVNGSLKKVLNRKDKYLDWRKRILVAMDAAIGMEYLHSKDIVHFDLKCDNLLVNVKDPSRPICKVADFGLSKMKQATLVSGGMRGTLPWMAPELLTMSGTQVSEKVDVYSFGVVMWEILTGEDPYDGMHYGGVIGGILSNTLRPPVPTSCNLEWRKLMEQCWSTEPERRPSFTEVVTCLRGMIQTSESLG